ncbi:MAG TPA: MASE1 domain-containing protein [bacterium]|nr:MASE1 domain-containing protein [bacterium]
MEEKTKSHRTWKMAAATAAIAVCYLIAGRLGLSVAAQHANVTFVWPPAGLALAALLLGGYRLAPGVFLGAFLVNTLTSLQWPAVLAIACGNTIEALLGAFLLRKVLGFQNAMERLRDVLGLIVLGGLVSTTAAATIGVTSLCLEGSASWASYSSLWFEWWVGDMLGILVLTPFLMTWSDVPHFLTTVWKAPWKVLEVIGLFALLIAAAQGIFAGWLDAHLASHLRSYIFPLLIWMAIRFGPKGATAATLTVSAFAVWGTLQGFGPFAGRTHYEDLLFLQLFLAVAVLTALPLAASISERKRGEEVKSEFASMVSHELRTPLSSIKAGIEVVLDGIDGPVTEDQRKTLGIARNNVVRLTRLINNVLDYSKLESGKMDVFFERTNMSQLIRETCDLMKLAMQNKGISFSLDLPSEPLFAVCDPDKIKQVVINLLDNAVKFTDKGGTIVAGLRSSDRHVLIDVKDTGIGIKEEDQEKIFEMFGQASGKIKRRGSGVGLAVCRLIVGQHKGRILVDSRHGRGSRLTVAFPDSLPVKKKAVPLT